MIQQNAFVNVVECLASVTANIAAAGESDRAHLFRLLDILDYLIAMVLDKDDRTDWFRSCLIKESKGIPLLLAPAEALEAPGNRSTGTCIGDANYGSQSGAATSGISNEEVSESSRALRVIQRLVTDARTSICQGFEAENVKTLVDMAAQLTSALAKDTSGMKRGGFRQHLVQAGLGSKRMSATLRQFDTPPPRHSRKPSPLASRRTDNRTVGQFESLMDLGASAPMAASRRIDEEFRKQVQSAGFRYWAAGDSVVCHGRRVLLGVALYSPLDLRFLDALSSRVASRRGHVVDRIDVFNLSDVEGQRDLIRYFPGIDLARDPRCPPFVGIWENGKEKGCGCGTSGLRLLDDVYPDLFAS